MEKIDLLKDSEPFKARYLFLLMCYIGFDAENRLVESVNVLCDVICDIADKVFKGQKLIASR